MSTIGEGVKKRFEVGDSVIFKGRPGKITNMAIAYPKGDKVLYYDFTADGTGEKAMVKPDETDIRKNEIKSFINPFDLATARQARGQSLYGSEVKNTQSSDYDKAFEDLSHKLFGLPSDELSDYQRQRIKEALEKQGIKKNEPDPDAKNANETDIKKFILQKLDEETTDTMTEQLVVEKYGISKAEAKSLVDKVYKYAMGMNAKNAGRYDSELEAIAQKLFKKPMKDLTEAEQDKVMEKLDEPWTKGKVWEKIPKNSVKINIKPERK